MKRFVVSGLAACVCVVAWGCDKGAEQPDPPAVEGGAQEASPAKEEAPEAKAIEGVLPDDETKAEIDAYWTAEVGYESFVPFYVSERGVAVDGADGVRYAPGTTRPADADMDGSLMIKSLMPALKAASKARAMSAEEMKRMKQLGLGVFVEPHVPYASLSSLVYTTAIGLRPTPADAESDRFVIFSGGQILKLMVRRAGTSDWDGYNATVQGLTVGPDSEAREAEAKKTQPSVRIDSRGIWVSLNDAPMSPVEGCPVGGPTLCNEGVADATELIAKVRSLEGAERQAALGELVALYDLRGLHDVLVSMKAKTPDETIARLSAGEDVPMVVVSAVAAATRTRHANPDASFKALGGELERPNHQGDVLFPDLILGM